MKLMSFEPIKINEKNFSLKKTDINSMIGLINIQNENMLSENNKVNWVISANSKSVGIFLLILLFFTQLQLLLFTFVFIQIMFSSK